MVRKDVLIHKTRRLLDEDNGGFYSEYRASNPPFPLFSRNGFYVR
jgi:hypothetical protein